jgi:hypothetical protein
VEPQAARAAVQARARKVFIMDVLLVLLAQPEGRCAAPADRLQRNGCWEKRPRTRPGVGGWAAAAWEEAYAQAQGDPGSPSSRAINDQTQLRAGRPSHCGCSERSPALTMTRFFRML